MKDWVVFIASIFVVSIMMFLGFGIVAIFTGEFMGLTDPVPWITLVFLNTSNFVLVISMLEKNRKESK